MAHIVFRIFHPAACKIMGFIQLHPHPCHLLEVIITLRNLRFTIFQICIRHSVMKFYRSKGKSDSTVLFLGGHDQIHIHFPLIAPEPPQLDFHTNPSISKLSLDKSSIFSFYPILIYINIRDKSFHFSPLRYADSHM